MNEFGIKDLSSILAGGSGGGVVFLLIYFVLKDKFLSILYRKCAELNERIHEIKSSDEKHGLTIEQLASEIYSMKQNFVLSQHCNLSKDKCNQTFINLNKSIEKQEEQLRLLNKLLTDHFINKQ
jgi:hypothetical protein